MKTWNNTDKSDWPPGEWKDEPDKAHWIYEGLDCLIVRGPGGALCGYVGVPESHPYFEKNYDTDPVWKMKCHGGLTFSDFCHETDDPSKHICHEKECAANDRVWWLGFDCAHYGDIAPKDDIAWRSDGTYSSFNYVKREVEYLARQLKEIDV